MKHNKEFSKEHSIENEFSYASDKEVDEEEIEERLVIDLPDEDSTENNYDLNKNNNSSKITEPFNNNLHFQKVNSDNKVVYFVNEQKNIIKIDLNRNTYEVVYTDKKENEQLEKVKLDKKSKPTVSNTAVSINKNNSTIFPNTETKRQQLKVFDTSLDSTKSTKYIRIPILPVTLKTENSNSFLNANKSNQITILFKKDRPQETPMSTTIPTQQCISENNMTGSLGTIVNEQKKKVNSIVPIKRTNCVKTLNHVKVLNSGNSLKSNQTLLLIKPIENYDKNTTTSNNKDFSEVKSNKSVLVNRINYFTLNTQTNSLVPISGFITATPIISTNQFKTKSTEFRLIPKSRELKRKENRPVILEKKNVLSDLKVSKEKNFHDNRDSVPINKGTMILISRKVPPPSKEKRLTLNTKESIDDALAVEQKKADDYQISESPETNTHLEKKSAINEITSTKNQESFDNTKRNINEKEQNFDSSIQNRIMIVKNNEINFSKEISLAEIHKKILEERNKQLKLTTVTNENEMNNTHEAANALLSFGSIQSALGTFSSVNENLLKENKDNLVSKCLKRTISESNKTTMTKKIKTSKSDVPIYECCICKIKLRNIELLNEHYKNHPEGKVFFYSKLSERHKLYCSSKKKFYKCKNCIKFSGYPF